MAKKTQTSLSDSINKLEAISDWFDQQKEIDLEKGLLKVKEGAALIKESRIKLKGIENEFEEIKAGMEDLD
jgi:exonuclease VII small subunit